MWMLKHGELQEGLGGSMRESNSATKSTEDFKTFLFRREEVDSKEVMKYLLLSSIIFSISSTRKHGMRQTILGGTQILRHENKKWPKHSGKHWLFHFLDSCWRAWQRRSSWERWWRLKASSRRHKREASEKNMEDAVSAVLKMGIKDVQEKELKMRRVVHRGEIKGWSDKSDLNLKWKARSY